jgi:hypothetical protein
MRLPLKDPNRNILFGKLWNLWYALFSDLEQIARKNEQSFHIQRAIFNPCR